MASKKTRVGAKAGVKKPSRKPAPKPTRKLEPKAARKPTRKPPPTRAREPVLPMNELLVAAKREPDVVELPSRSALSIAGDGGPETSLFQSSIGALYGIAYTLKFARKKAGKDFKIGPLEGCWWAEGAPFGSQVVAAARDTWRWRLRIAVPGDVTESEVAGVILAATTKKGGKLEGSADAGRVGLERIPSARMGRILHFGPYSEEPASFERIRTALAAKGLRGGNAHLEIYLSDPMRTEPSKLKTVLLLELGG
jgi:hypothetical protein